MLIRIWLFDRFVLNKNLFGFININNIWYFVGEIFMFFVLFNENRIRKVLIILGVVCIFYII